MYNGKKVGIGIVTYNRPDYFKQCVDHIEKNIKSVDCLVIYNDGSTTPYPLTMKPANISEFEAIFPDKNHGVAYGKNALLQAMLKADCDYLFTLEDDILLLDDKAVTEYIRLGEEYGLEHLMFAHHGPANLNIKHYEDKDIAYWPNCIGAWCYYTRNCLISLRESETEKKMEYAGLFDENFKNAWEHVEHTTRLGNEGFTGWFGMFPDITDSQKYISEIKGAIDNSSIRSDKKWRDNIKSGLDYWKQKHGSEFPDKELVINLNASQEEKQDKRSEVTT